MLRWLLALLPALLMGGIVGYSWMVPVSNEFLESCVSPELPLEDSLPGWWGVKVQESEQERTILAVDTLFSKGRYERIRRVDWEKKYPAVEVSLVYSGNDLNNSIHRPERCLPAQGHQQLRFSTKDVTLENGKTLTFSRLSTHLPIKNEKVPRLHFIHYYVFFGHDSVTHSHYERTIKDMASRVFLGRVQRWGYFQVGSYWAPEIGVTEEEADKQICELIQRLSPRIIDWSMLAE